MPFEQLKKLHEENQQNKNTIVLEKKDTSSDKKKKEFEDKFLDAINKVVRPAFLEAIKALSNNGEILDGSVTEKNTFQTNYPKLSCEIDLGKYPEKMRITFYGDPDYKVYLAININGINAERGFNINSVTQNDIGKAIVTIYKAYINGELKSN